LVVLRLLLDAERNPPEGIAQILREAANRASVVAEAVAEVEWEPYDGHAPVAGVRYKLRDGSVIRYDPNVDAERIPDIESVERE
jgi:hypothetical protein